MSKVPITQRGTLWTPLLISPALTPKARVVLPPSRTVTTTRLLRRPKHLVRLSLFKYALQFEHASGNDAQMLHPSTIKSLTRKHYILHELIQFEFKSALLCFMTEINFDTEETLTILNTLHHWFIAIQELRSSHSNWFSINWMTFGIINDIIHETP